MVVEIELEYQNDDQDECLHCSKHPHLRDPIRVHEGMDNALQQWPDSISNGHQGIGIFESEHVTQKVSGEFPVLRIILSVAGKGSDQNPKKAKMHSTCRNFEGRSRLNRVRKFLKARKVKNCIFP